MLRPALAALALLLAPAAASAQAMTFDPVFVSRFVPADPSQARAAEHVRVLLEERLTREFLLVAREEVPAFEDYSAEVYLNSCPADQFFGCAFVIGNRAQAEWVVAGKVEAGASGTHVDVVFIDVTESRMVFSFDANVTPANEKAFADGVAALLHKIVEGAGAERDIRGEVEDPAARATRERLQREALAASLTEMEGDLDAMARTVVEGELDSPKLTKESLAEKYGTSEASKPWERVGMGEAEYVRFKNSGRSLPDWRARKHGRAARVLASASVGSAHGPFSQQFDGRWALSGQTLDLLEVDEFQEVENGNGLLTGVELGVGVHPWFDVGLAINWRSGHYTYLLHQEVEGQVEPGLEDAFVDLPESALMSSTQFLGRVRFAPMPTSSWRPTASVGLGSWSGTALDRIVAAPSQLQTLPRPTATFLEVAGGAEVDPNELFSLFGTLQTQIPLAGDLVQEYEDGPPTLVYTAEPDGPRGLSYELSVGVRFKVGPFLRFQEKTSPTEDEDDL